MPSFDAVSLDDLRRRRSEKWRRDPADVLAASTAELDFAVAPGIAAVLTEAIAAGDLGYAHAQSSGLPRALAGFAARRWGWEVDPEAVVAVPEIMVGVAELLRILTRPGDGVVINTPVYPPFFSVLAEIGRPPVEVPLLGPDEDRRLPVDGIREALAGGAKALLLCNPHNPTGYVAHRDELLAVARVAAEHDAIVLSDEIHAPLVFGGSAHVPFCSLGADAETGITLTSASKGWNIPGLKCALAVAASARMRRALAALPVDMPDRVGQLGVIATEEAYANGEPWLDELLLYLEETQRRLPGLLAERLPGVRYDPGQATYLAWLDCCALGLGDDPAAVFLERGRVGVVAGHRFGEPGRGFVRLNFGTSRALVEEAVDRMARTAGS